MNELTRFGHSALRPRLSSSEVTEAKREGWLISDPQRARTRFFDGLLLKAGELTRDQDYFLARQADMQQLGTAGVVHGLTLSRGPSATSLIITRGHGVTAAGESVVLFDDLTLDVSDVAAIERFDATFGLEVRPDTPMRNRAGLFVLALRNVEFSANPVAAYPSSLQAERVLQDGEIIEAVAVTLIPIEEVAVTDVRNQGQARLAHEVFVRGGLRSLSPEVLPIGVLALDRSDIVWFDEYLVRRDKSANDGVGFDRPEREAHLRHYLAQLRAIQEERATLPGTDRPFMAVDQFRALPAFGSLPLESVRVEGDALIQSFFPPELGVEITIVPVDELPALAEEALSLGPIDLTARADLLEDYQLLVLVPVARTEFATRVSDLEGKLSRTPRARISRPLARLAPISVLQALRRRHRAPTTEPPVADLQTWQDALAAVAGDDPARAVLHYVLRKRFSEVPFAAARFQSLPPDSPEPTETMNRQVRARLIAAGELDPPERTPRITQPLDFLLRGTTNEVARAVEALFGLPVFVLQRMPTGASEAIDTSIFVSAAVDELAARTRVRLDDLLVSAEARASVTRLAPESVAPPGSAPARVRALSLDDIARTRRRYQGKKSGDGLAELIHLAPRLASAEARESLVRSLRVPELDGTALSLATEDEKRTFANTLLGFALAAQLNNIRDMVDDRFGPVEGGPDEVRYDPIPGFDGSGVAIRLNEGRLYYLIHFAANATNKDTISALLSRPTYNVRFIVSTLLAHLLSEGWDLRLETSENARSALEALAEWDAGEKYEPPEARSPDGANLNVPAGDAASVLNAYDKIETLPLDFRQSLPTLLAGLGQELDPLRTIALAGSVNGQPTGIQVIAKLFQLQANSAGQQALISGLRAAANARDLGQIRTLLSS